jgi:hypothetical protein
MSLRRALFIGVAILLILVGLVGAALGVPFGPGVRQPS